MALASQQGVLVSILRHRLALSGTIIPRRHPALVYLYQLSPSSQSSIRWTLDKIAAQATEGICTHLTLNWAALRYEDVVAIRGFFLHRYSAQTAGKAMAALRRVLREAWRLGYMTAEEYQRAVDVGPISKPRASTTRALSVEELAALFAVLRADLSPHGIRNLAIFTVMVSTGIRRLELVQIDLRDYNRQSGELVVRHGKGNQRRIVYVGSPEVRRVMERWLKVRGPDGDALFCSIHTTGAIRGKRVDYGVVGRFLADAAKAAGISHVHPHQLRHTNITMLLDQGGDLDTVSDWAGHADPATTKRYSHRGERAKQRLAAQLKLPFGEERSD